MVDDAARALRPVKKDDIDEFGIGGPSRAEQPAPSGGAQDAIPFPDADIAALAKNIFGETIAAGGSAFQQALANRLAARAPIINRRRRWVVGMGPLPVGPHQTVTQQAQTRCLFRGEKIINTGDATGLFMSSLFVGQKSQFPTFQNPIALNQFSANVLDREMLMDTCDPSSFITAQIQNVTAATLTFSMSIIGHAIT